jgi:hypothetical protein
MPTSKKPAKKPATAKTAGRPASVYKVVKNFPNGVRAQCMDVIPAAGATIEAIGAALQRKHKIEARKAAGYIHWLASNGYVKHVEA